MVSEPCPGAREIEALIQSSLRGRGRGRRAFDILLLDTAFLYVGRLNNLLNHRLHRAVVALYFRHDWELPLSWLTPTYLKVSS